MRLQELAGLFGFGLLGLIFGPMLAEAQSNNEYNLPGAACLPASGSNTHIGRPHEGVVVNNSTSSVLNIVCPVQRHKGVGGTTGQLDYLWVWARDGNSVSSFTGHVQCSLEIRDPYVTYRDGDTQSTFGSFTGNFMFNFGSFYGSYGTDHKIYLSCRLPPQGSAGTSMLTTYMWSE